MRFLTLDNAYPDAFNSMPHSSHDEWFAQLFGTSNFLDIAWRAAGHEATTLVRNFFSTHDEMMGVAKDWEPDVVLSREAGRFSAAYLRPRFPNAKLICTCSHRVEDSQLAGFDAVFSSFKWMKEHCATFGVRCEYLPLAFGRTVLDSVPTAKERDIPVCFIGGLGSRIWEQGTATMAAISDAIPAFRWWGYWAADSLQSLPQSLQRTYQGQAWGIDMYRILARTKILVNRHGEICKGWANNCRAYEGPGCGCLTLNDFPGETNYGPVYCSAEAAIEWINALQVNPVAHLGMSHPFDIEFASNKAQADILANHTFEARVPKMIEVIESL